MKPKIFVLTRFLTLFSLVLLVVVLSACRGSASGTGSSPQSPAETAQAAPIVEDVVTPGAAVSCAEMTDAPDAYVDASAGFCFRIPVGYTITVFDFGEVMVQTDPPGFPQPRLPFATLNIEPADGRSADQVADDVVSEFQSAISDFFPERTSLSLGSAPTVVLDQMPGQDLNRQVFAVHAGQLYRLTFYTSTPDTPEYEQAMALYTMLTDSFVFFEPTVDAPEAGGAGDPCLAGDGLVSYVSEAYGYCLAYPQGFAVEQPAEGVTVVRGPDYSGGGLEPLVGAVSIQVSGPAEGRSASQVADNAVAFYASAEQAAIERRPLDLDGVPAVELNNLPGQRVYRQVIAVRNGQVYLLDFTPLGAEYGQAAADMQQLYESVLGSFNFLD